MGVARTWSKSKIIFFIKPITQVRLRSSKREVQIVPIFPDRSISALQNGHFAIMPLYIWSLWPEIGEFASRAGYDRATEERAGKCRAGGQSKAGRAKQSRAWAKSRAGHDDHGHCAI